MQNAFIESINGRLRDEFLNVTLFTSLAGSSGARGLAGRTTTPCGLIRRSAGWRPRSTPRTSHRKQAKGAALRNGSAPWPVARTVKWQLTDSQRTWIRVGGNVRSNMMPHLRIWATLAADRTSATKINRI